MVSELLGGRYPLVVEKSLISKVDELINEGQDPAIVREALKLWLDKPDAGVALLPYLIANVMRGGGERTAALRQAYRSGDTKPLAQFGWVFTPPDLPLDIKTVADAKAFMLAAKRKWITDIQGGS